jgi:glycosyltransferase involved in cell wall biosynthesis
MLPNDPIIMERPLISVVIPVYNCERYLGEAIRSVLSQDYCPLELIVVDDGSTDDSAAVAGRFPGVQVIRKPHAGIASTHNQGIGRCRGEWLAFLDSDDRWVPGKLARQTRALEEDAGLDMVFGYCRQFRAGETLAIQPGLAQCAMLVRRSSFERVGLYNEGRAIHHFVDWYARAQEAGLRSLMLPDIVYERRIHDQNIGRRLPAAQRLGYLRALRESLHRRRQAGTGGDQEPPA